MSRNDNPGAVPEVLPANGHEEPVLRVAEGEDRIDSPAEIPFFSRRRSTVGDPGSARIQTRLRREPPVLIGEDNFLTARLLAAVLQNEGRTVVIARDGEEVLRNVVKHQPRLLVLNMNLCRPSGMEVLRVLQPHREKLQIIAFTAPGQGDLRAAASTLGAGVFFEMPFYPAELADRIRLMLKEKR